MTESDDAQFADRHERYLRFLELEARAERGEEVELPFAEMAEFLESCAEFGACAIDAIPVNDPRNPRRKHFVNILKQDVQAIAGSCPLVCPNAQPQLPKWMLPGLEKHCRALGIVTEGQTVLYVGHQTKQETVCGYCHGCECFEEKETPKIPESDSEVAPSSKRRIKKPSVNDRMRLTLLDNDEALGWSASKWAEHLKCTKSTVAGTDTWKTLEQTRLRNKAQHRLDRRRKTKPPSD
jgi:hypothetical protein